MVWNISMNFTMTEIPKNIKKNLLLLLCLFCLVNVCHAKAKDTFTVFQLNLWHGCTKVPNGDQGIIDVLDQMDADVVFLCEIRDGKQFIPHDRRAGEERKTLLW